jgi:hypothetical protein
MTRLLVLISAVMLMSTSVAPAADKKPAKRGKGAPAVKSTSFTGCIDQRGENYVLTGDKELRTVAVLHGEGFNDDNFAREMGHKVTVEGTLAGDADPKTIRVTKVTKISDTCAAE